MKLVFSALAIACVHALADVADDFEYDAARLDKGRQFSRPRGMSGDINPPQIPILPRRRSSNQGHRRHWNHHGHHGRCITSIPGTPTPCSRTMVPTCSTRRPTRTPTCTPTPTRTPTCTPTPTPTRTPTCTPTPTPTCTPTPSPKPNSTCLNESISIAPVNSGGCNPSIIVIDDDCGCDSISVSDHSKPPVSSITLSVSPTSSSASGGSDANGAQDTAKASLVVAFLAVFFTGALLL